MSAKDSITYWWVKFGSDFFDGHKVKILNVMEGGREALLLYIKLLVESVSHGGELRSSPTKPYTREMIAALTATPIDIVNASFELLKDLELLVEKEDGTLFFPDIDDLIGHETGAAIRKREYRTADAPKPPPMPQKVRAAKPRRMEPGAPTQTVRIVEPDNPNSTAPIHVIGAPSKAELDAALAPIPAPAPLEWFLKFRSTNATRLVVLGRNVTEDEVRSWYEVQQGQGGWRYQNAASTPITIRNFTGSLRKHAERLRKEASSGAAAQGFGRDVLDEHCKSANALSPGSVTKAEADAFWDSLVRSGFTAKDGSRITKSNFTYYLSLAVKFSRGQGRSGSDEQEEWARRGFSSPDEMRDEIRLARKLLAAGEITQEEFRERVGDPSQGNGK